MNYIIEGSGALVNEAGEETPLKAGDFALVNPDENTSIATKGINLSKGSAGCRRSLSDASNIEMTDH